MDHYGQLKRIMDRLLSAHHHLLKVQDDQRAALIKGDMDGILRNVERLQQELDKIASLEAERQEIVRQFANELGISSDSISVSLLAERIVDPWKRASLSGVSEELKSVVAEADRRNQLNAELTIQSLTYVTKVFEWMARLTKRGTYTRLGHKDSSVEAQFISVQS